MTSIILDTADTALTPYPIPGPGLAGLEPEVAQIVLALERLGLVQPVLLAAVGPGWSGWPRWSC